MGSNDVEHLPSNVGSRIWKFSISIMNDGVNINATPHAATIFCLFM